MQILIQINGIYNGIFGSVISYFLMKDDIKLVPVTLVQEKPSSTSGSICYFLSVAVSEVPKAQHTNTPHLTCLPTSQAKDIIEC